MNQQLFEQYLHSIRQTQHPQQLPEIHIDINRPLCNFNALFGLVFGTPATILGVLMIINDWRIGLGWIVLLMGLVGLGIAHEQLINHKFTLHAMYHAYSQQ